MSTHIRGGKRRRRRPPAFSMYQASATAAEERYLQQAIQNSKMDQSRPVDGHLDIPWGPVFYPTVAEMEGNPVHYIAKIRHIAEPYGICKIIPPAGWKPPFCVDLDSPKKFQTKQQLLHRLQEGISFGDGVDYAVEDYVRVATQRTAEWKERYYPDHDLLSRHAAALAEKDSKAAAAEAASAAAMTTDSQQAPAAVSSSDAERKLFSPENLERDFWSIIETDSKEVVVEYGNDIDTSKFGSGFALSERGRSVHSVIDPDKVDLPEPKFGTEDYYKETWWNLNNIPWAPDSVLRHVKVGINGINVPWMYYGSLFTTFCWHNEDNYMYSINYHHKGAPKQWYGVPGTKQAADGLEKVFKSYLSMKMRDLPDLLHHITTMFSPRLLQNADVPVSKLLQHEGEFVVTFPRAFHGGFSLGPNCGEAVNFASHDWITHGMDANERYRTFARPAVFSHDRLTCTMANHLNEQKSSATCRLLLNELERIVGEELTLRKQLQDTGVRDVSDIIKLPPNRLDQLDDSSANYDDKRLCHACKHVCFFSAVACECSTSKVSCLRHSSYMCRCVPAKKYFMLWSKEKELRTMLERVRTHCANLEKAEGDSATAQEGSAAGQLGNAVTHGSVLRPGIVATGVSKDLELHKHDDISKSGLDTAQERKQSEEQKRNSKAGSGLSIVSSETSSPLLGDDEVQIVGYRGGTGATV